MRGKRKHKESKINMHLARSVFLLNNLISLKSAKRQKPSTQLFNKKGSKSFLKKKKKPIVCYYPCIKGVEYNKLNNRYARLCS
jgi:hypothetical protein